MENQKPYYDVVIKWTNENNDVIKEKTLAIIDNNDIEEYLGRYLPTMEKLINQINNEIDEGFRLKDIRFNITKDSDKKLIIIHAKLSANNTSYMKVSELVDTLTIFLGEIARKVEIFHDIDENELIIRLTNPVTNYTLTLTDKKDEVDETFIETLGKQDDGDVTILNTCLTNNKRSIVTLSNGYFVTTTLRKNVLYKYERQK